MLNFILNRILQLIITLLVISAAVFFIVRLTGNPVDLMVGEYSTAESREAISKELGLDKPIIIQYGKFLAGMVKGDFGKSIRYGKPTTEIFFDHLPSSLRLIGLAVMVAIVIAVPLGVIAATRRGSMLDQMATIMSTLGLAFPHFWIALALILVFSVWMGLLPSMGMGNWKNYILPVITLSISLTAGIMRLLRSSMLNTLRTEYIKFARNKGVSESRVVWRHSLRNAILPVIHYVMMYTGVLITGSIITEQIFAWPGVGWLVYSAILWRDYPLVQTCIVLKAVFVVVINTVADIVSAFADPRIRFGKRKQ